MPAAKYKASATLWKAQRGTVYGTTTEGMDFVEMKFRGPSGTSKAWRAGWDLGNSCPYPGFPHCKLTARPKVAEEGAAFSVATLRFEGPTDINGEGGGSGGEGEDTSEPVITKTRNRSSFEVDETWYSYDASVGVVRYVASSEPDEATHSVSLEEPKPLKKESGEGPTVATLGADKWHVITGEGYIQDIEATGGIYRVTEIHEKWLEPT